MPCFNEREVVGYTIRRLVGAFRAAEYWPEVIAVDNGSSDDTGAIICAMQTDYPGLVVHHRVERNEGYGHGILSGLPLCTAPWVGIIPADGQVDAEDVVRLYEALISSNGPVMGKVRRRFRMDGLKRKLTSTVYNLFVRALWPKLGSLDINGNPKILPRDAANAMRLESKGWCLDPEIMVKAHYMGMRVLEFNVFARMRGGGVSHVRAETCWEFFSTLLAFRFSDRLARWRTETAPEPSRTSKAFVASR
jgi:glycosyltransferase involved in cell wall biosynthesis